MDVEDFSYIDSYLFEAFTLISDNKSHGSTKEKFLNSLKENIKNTETQSNTLKAEIAILKIEKEQLTANDLTIIDEKIQNMTNEIYLNIEKFAMIETDCIDYQNYSKSLHESIKNKFKGKNITNDLILSLKQEQSDVQNQSLTILNQLYEYQSEIESYKEECSKIEKRTFCNSKEKQLLELQESIDSMRAENSKLLEDLKNSEKMAGELSLEISGFEVKFRKEENQLFLIVSEDKDNVLAHVSKVTGWLGSMDVNNYIY